MRCTHSISISRIVVSIAFSLAVLNTVAQAQIGYGVNGAGNLFRFDVDVPSVVTVIGPVGFVPEGIDFRPGTSSLYALDVGPNTTQLYTLDINSAAPTAVGAGFPSSGANYNLTVNQSFGFDFNPKTLQADNSMRIRVVSTSGTNLRLHSATGQIAAVDTNLAFANGNSPFVDAAAYINNVPEIGGTTSLYDLDSRNDALLLQNPPNAGTVATVGPFGVTVDALGGMGFDIYTTPGNVDPTISGDFAFGVIKRPDAPVNGILGSYLLYDVDLATGAITNGATVGSALNPYDFAGGFAVTAAVPEPTSLSLIVVAVLAGIADRRRRQSH